MKFDLYCSNVTDVKSNTRYPSHVVVESSDDMKKAAEYDHVCAEYKDNYRGKERFIRSNVLPMDCDNDHSETPDDWITIEKLDKLFPGISYVVVPSRSSMKQKGNLGPRFRFHIYFEISEFTDHVRYAALKIALQHQYPFFDEGCLDAGRFLIGVKNAEVADWHEGFENIDNVVDITERDIAEASKTEIHQKPQDIPADGEETIPEGVRNRTLLGYAEKVLTRFGNTDKAYKLFINESYRCTPPLGKAELSSIWTSAKKYYLNTISKKEGYVSPEQYIEDFPPESLQPDDYSDMGEAKVLVREFGNELKFTEGTDYIRYDGEVWNESVILCYGAVKQFLDLQLEEVNDDIETALSALEESGVDRATVEAGGKKLAAALNTEQLKLYTWYLSRKSYYKFVVARRNFNNIKATLDVAKPDLRIPLSYLDKDEFLLNTPGVTYDLRKGMHGGREPHADDFITKQTAVAPSDERKELWDDALDLFFCGDKELISYVQEIVGLASIGKVYVEALIISYGEGSNGKSTFWNTISRVLGTYSGGISADALTVGCKRNVKPEMAELMGKRLVIAAELEEGVRLNTSTIKQLCSTDEITAEKKFKPPFTFIPSHTLVLYTNHLPKVGANDAGTWRRLIVIPFKAKIQGAGDIKNYSDYLFEKAGPAVLKWIIEGAERVISHCYQLKYPKCVQDAIAAYRENNDWLGAFLEDCCDMDPSYMQKSGDFYDAYRAYSLNNKEYVRGTADFYSALEIAGFEKVKTKQGRYVKGLKLKEEFMN